MRLFIAINFNDATRSALLALRDELRSRSERGRFSLPENLHLTLAFLGECEQRDAAPNGRLRRVMDDLSFEPFEIQVERVGRFKRDGGDIWWAGLRGCKPLIDLQRELTDKLIDAGLSLEKREYKPHITLGREIVTDAAPWQIEPFGETVYKIDLMKSERIGGRLTYTAIYKR